MNANNQTKKYDIKINVGSGLPEYAGKSAKDIELLLKQNSAWIDDFWLMKFNPLTAILDGVSELLTKAKIPERYYNPDNTDYNPFPSKIYSYVSLKVIDDELSGLVGSPMGEKYTSSRIDFAFTCGVWNGLVGTAAAIPEGGSFLIKMITNENDARTNFATTISKIEWKAVKDMVGEQWNKYTSNPCMVSYGAGEVTFVVASCFIGAGEIKGATAVVQTMEKLDVMGQLLGKTIQIAGKVIKPVVSASGKAVKYVLKEGVDFIKRIDIKVTPSGFGCGFPIQNIKISLKNKLVNLTEQEAQGIKQKIEQAINNEGGLDKLPVDENGNHLVEIEVDGEKVTAVVGSEDGLNKIKSADIDPDFNFLLQDENLNNIYNLYKNNLRQRSYSELTIEEEAILYHYTKYSSVVRANKEYYPKYKEELDKAINKLTEKYKGTVFSGQNFNDEIIQKFKNGNYFEFDDILSTSKLKKQALDKNLVPKDGNVLLEIDVYNGKPIEKVSSFPEEAEVLMNSDVTYMVKDVKTIPHPTKPGKTILYVKLEQM